MLPNASISGVKCSIPNSDKTVSATFSIPDMAGRSAKPWMMTTGYFSNPSAGRRSSIESKRVSIWQRTLGTCSQGGMCNGYRAAGSRRRCNGSCYRALLWLTFQAFVKLARKYTHRTSSFLGSNLAIRARKIQKRTLR